jgi:hypothetical protein
LVIMETNEALDFEEISVKNLALLKLTYPSAARDNNSKEYKDFENNFRKVNKVAPNQFATRGFDVTFDAILRICQPEGFENSTTTKFSEGIESKFDYQNKQNKGVYIQYYNTDLTIQTAN